MARPLLNPLRALPVMVLMFAPPALACPVCDSPTGGEVRAGIAGDGLAAGLLGTLLPFALTAAVVALVHCGGSTRRAGDGDADRP